MTASSIARRKITLEDFEPKVLRRLGSQEISTAANDLARRTENVPIK